MTQYIPGTRGDLADRIRLILGGEELLITEGYDVHQGVLTQPSAFSLRLGYGDVVRKLAAKYPPGTKFQLYVGEALRFTGLVDGYTLAGEAGATEITLHGRDLLARFHDAYILADKTYTNHTYAALVLDVLYDALGETVSLVSDNSGNRLTQAGLNNLGGAGAGSGVATKRDPIVSSAPFGADVLGKVSQAVLQAAKDQAAGASQPAQPDPPKPATAAQGAMLAKAGERYYEFLKKELDRAGLCLWASADGESFVLTSPDGNQAPIGRIVRRRGTSGNVVNVLSARYTFDTSKRFSHCTIYARTGGKKAGRTKSQGDYEDAEMVALGFNRPLVIRDHKCSNNKQAEYLARRKIAEANRAGVNYVVTVAGHSFPAIGSGERAVWTPDTVVDVSDDEFGLTGPMYLEQVAFKRHPQTTTELTLLRVQDLVFAADPPT